MSVPGDRYYTLADGGTLVVRAVRPDDADGLAELYRGLDVDDLHNRFFSVYRPDRAFVERIAAVQEHGGYGLVAVAEGTDGADPGGRLVAEAGWFPLPNGDGELAIAVAKEWRGWLGPVLLDALIEAAAAHGVPNLEADILVTNTPMQRLARSRGVATLPSDDWVSTRLLIGAAGRTPTWPGPHQRPRVLVETPGGRWHAAPGAAKVGLEVLACSGPRGARVRCPALSGEPCPLVAAADAVVVSWPPDDERWDALARSHGRLHPGVPVCVETRPTREAATPVPPGATLAPAGDDEAGTQVVRLVERLARRHAASSGGADGPGARPPT